MHTKMEIETQINIKEDEEDKGRQINIENRRRQRKGQRQKEIKREKANNLKQLRFENFFSEFSSNKRNSCKDIFLKFFCRKK